MKITLDFSNQKSKKQRGEYYLKLRIYRGKDQRIISTGVTCKPEQFDRKLRVCTDSSKQTQINDLIHHLQKIINSLEKEKGGDFFAKDVVSRFNREEFYNPVKGFSINDIADLDIANNEIIKGLIERVEQLETTLKLVLKGKPIPDKPTTKVFLLKELGEIIEHTSHSEQQLKKFEFLKNNLSKYYKYKNIEDIGLLDINEKFLFNFNVFLKGRHIAKSSMVLIFSKLKKANRIIGRDKGITSQDIEKYKPDYSGIEKSEMIRDILIDEQIDKMLSYNASTEIKQESVNLFLFTYALGAVRVGDIASLTWSQIKKEYIYMIASKTGKETYANFDDLSKRRKNIINSVLEFQRKFKRHINSYVFYNKMKNNPNNHSTLTYHLQNIAKELKFKDEEGKQINLTGNSARHSFAYSVVVNNDLTLWELRDIFNHSSVQTTEKYLKSLKRKEIQEKIRKKIKY